MKQETTWQMLARYTELVFYKTYADLKAESTRTYLGILWWIFEPVMYMAIFYVVFGIAMQQGTPNFVQFLLIGLTAWQWMKSSVSHGSESILIYRPLMQQAHLPKVLFPTILILTDTTKFIFILLILLLYLWLTGFPITYTYLTLPLVLGVEFLFILALTYFFAAIVPFLPDLRFVIENVFQAVFFASGIFFSAVSIPEQYRVYFYLNPMATLIEDFRNVLMYNTMPDFQALAIIGFCSLMGIVFSIFLISRFEYTYPKITV